MRLFMLMACSFMTLCAATAMAVAAPARLVAADTTGATHCTLRGYSTDPDPKGTNVRAGPSADAPVIGRLPPRGPMVPNDNTSEIVGPEFDIVGSKDGWLLIRNAGGTSEDDDAVHFPGPGWISGGLVGFTIGSPELRAAPAAGAEVIMRLGGESKGTAYGADSFGVIRVHGCQQHFADVTIRPPRGLGLPPQPIRGWVGRVCGNQLTTCDPAVAVLQSDESAEKAGCMSFGPNDDAADGTTCKPVSFTGLGTVGGHDFAVSIYRYVDKDNIVTAGRAVVFQRVAPPSPDGALAVLFKADADGAYFDTPRLVKSPAGMLLQLRAHESGTGNFNRERLYLWRGGAWREVDAESWLDELARRLPKGLAARKGIFPDYATMTAQTPLWKNGDGNAGPSGDRADIALTWVGDRIAVKRVTVRAARKGEDGGG